MKPRWILAVLAAAILAAPPAGATLRRLRIEGVVDSITGQAVALPLPVAIDDEVAVEFLFDDEVGDVDPSPAVGSYPLQSLSLFVDGEEAVYLGGNPLTGLGFIGVQTTPGDQLWGVGGCAAGCLDNDKDELQFIVHLPDGSLTSDALVPPPSVMGAVVEFELHSVHAAGKENAVVDIFPTGVIDVPEPAGALSLAAGALVLAAARRARR